VTVHLVGAGPGDPGLITVRGAELLARADVVVHDRLSARELLDLAPPDAELIDVGKSPDGPSTPQSAINELLVERGRRGQTVVRLKGGDPFVFARGAEEAAALAAAGVERKKNGVGRLADAADAVGGAFQRLVVDQHRGAIRGEHDVELDGAAAGTRGGAKAGERVLRRPLAAAAMRDQRRQPDHFFFAGCFAAGFAAAGFAADPFASARTLPRATAVSSASLAVFLPAQTASSSSSTMMRTGSICETRTGCVAPSVLSCA